MAAAEGGHAKLVGLLLTAGADPDKQVTHTHTHTHTHRHTDTHTNTHTRTHTHTHTRTHARTHARTHLPVAAHIYR